MHKLDHLLHEKPEKRMRVLEVGGTSRPVLKKDGQYVYVGLDLDDSAMGADLYDEFYCQSVTEEIPGKYDLIFSKYLLEHVDDNSTAMSRMSNALFNGGFILHLVPCGRHPYSMITRAVGNKLQNSIIKWFRPNSMATTGYPVFYDRCTPTALEHLAQKHGLELVDCYAAWGASMYFGSFVPAFLAVRLFNSLARRLSLRSLASGFLLCAMKPGDNETS